MVTPLLCHGGTKKAPYLPFSTKYSVVRSVGDWIYSVLTLFTTFDKKSVGDRYFTAFRGRAKYSRMSFTGFGAASLVIAAAPNTACINSGTYSFGALRGGFFCASLVFCHASISV